MSTAFCHIDNCIIIFIFYFFRFSLKHGMKAFNPIIIGVAITTTMVDDIVAVDSMKSSTLVSSKSLINLFPSSPALYSLVIYPTASMTLSTLSPIITSSSSLQLEKQTISFITSPNLKSSLVKWNENNVSKKLSETSDEDIKKYDKPKSSNLLFVSNQLPYCPEDVYTQDQIAYRVYANMPIGLFGILSNILNIFVFFDYEMRTALVNHFLLALSISGLFY